MQTFFERQLEQAHRTGKQIGLTKGQRQTHIHNITMILAVRFAVEQETYEGQLAQLTLPQLEILSREALLVEQVETFTARLNEMLPS